MLNTIDELLKNSKIDNFDAKLILGYIIKKPREFIFTHPEFKVAETLSKRFFILCSKRRGGLPIAYITGQKEFFGLKFYVDKNTLVPRPETELLVESAINEIKNFDFKAEKILIIDVGTGSGCIPVSIFKDISSTNIKNIVFVASDISKSAVKIAKKNAKFHKAKIKFLSGDLLKPTFSLFKNEWDKIIITANLPYLTKEQYKKSSSIQREPYLALVAQKNGIALYEKLILQIKKYISCKDIVCFFEVDPSQMKKMKKLISYNFPKAKVQIKKDLVGHDRVVKFELTELLYC
jgi:release factor glutamine methyltransferase